MNGIVTMLKATVKRDETLAAEVKEDGSHDAEESLVAHWTNVALSDVFAGSKYDKLRITFMFLINSDTRFSCVSVSVSHAVFFSAVFAIVQLTFGTRFRKVVLQLN